MTQAFRDAAWDDKIAVVVLTGTGDRAFCTGGDVKEYDADTALKWGLITRFNQNGT